MDQHVGFGDAVLAELHDFEREAAGRQPQALVPRLAEDQRRAVLDVDLGIGRHLAVGEVVEHAVVVDDAVLEDLDEGGAPIGVGALEHAGQVLLLGVDGAGDETRARTQRESHRRDRQLDRAVGSRGRPCALARGRRILALGQAVDLVVEQQDLQIDVAPQRMQQVVAADRERIAVAADDPDVEFRIGQLDAGGDRRRAAVNAVKAVAGDVIGKARGAADAGHEDGVFRDRLDIGQGLFHRLEDRIVAAAGAPTDLLVGGVVLGPQFLGAQVRERSRDVHLSPPSDRVPPPRSRRS